MRCRQVAALTGQHSVTRLCSALGVSRTRYYEWAQQPVSAHHREDRRLLAHIRAIYRQSRQRYGSPRVHAELLAAGIRCSRKRVARLMNQDGLHARPRRRWRSTTQPRSSHRTAPNRLQRQFRVAAPDTVWSGDITYLWTQEGWLYLAVLLDLCSRRVVGWAAGDRLTRELTLEALSRAVTQRRPGAGVLHHSDRGCQYTCGEYQEELTRRGFEISMSRPGDCYDNAPVESFFSTLKAELTRQGPYRTRREAVAALFEYIEVFYNRRRRHSSLGYLSPVTFEERQLGVIACNLHNAQVRSTRC